MTPTTLITVLASAAAALIGLMSIAMAQRFRKFLKSELSRPVPNQCAKLALLVPCKGLDPGFDQNITALFEQDHPNYQLIFATATEDDEACPALQKMIEAHPHVKAKLVHAGLPDNCSQQNNNQIHAATHADEDVEILAVMDSDSRPHKQYLRWLASPLGDQDVGAATGYRWYMPVKGGFASWLRSTWNMGAFPILADSKRNFAWGGSMAFRKKDFPIDLLRNLWGATLSDDHTLTTHVREQGKLIKYVPQCLAVSHEDSTFGETFEWTTRQTLVTRVYDKPFWWSVLVIHTLSVLFTTAAVYGVCLNYLWPENPSALADFWPALMLPMFCQGIAVTMMLPPLLRLLPDGYREKAMSRISTYIVLAQPASLLAFCNSVASLLTNRVTWRGTTYEMRSPTQTVVISGAP